MHVYARIHWVSLDLALIFWDVYSLQFWICKRRPGVAIGAICHCYGHSVRLIIPYSNVAVVKPTLVAHQVSVVCAVRLAHPSYLLGVFVFS